MLKKPDREDRGLNKRDFYDGLNARRKWLWSSSLADTHTHSPPSLSLIHSLTLCDALLHSSLPGAVKKARETHKSKLKCSSECFLDVMHGPWDAARPCCYTCKPDVGTVQQKETCYFPSRTTFLDWDIFDFRHGCRMQCRTSCVGVNYKATSCEGLSVTRKWLAWGVIPVSVASCHITSLPNWFLLAAFHLNINGLLGKNKNACSSVRHTGPNVTSVPS